MARLILATDQASTFLYLDLVAIAAFSFLATLVAGVLAFKTLTRRREKKQVILTASWFAAGVFMGTAMCDLLSESDIFFHVMGFNYPLAFVFSCTGYGLFMFIDCLIAPAVKRLTRECFENSQLKSKDKIMMSLVDIQPTKCCNATLPIETSKSETKDCDGKGPLRCVILYRTTVLVDFFFLLYPLMVLSMAGGGKIWSANTKTISSKAILNATSHSVVYIISLVFTVLRSIESIPFVESLFLMVIFSILSPLGIMVELIGSMNESLVRTVFGGEAVNDWVVGIVTGLFSGILVYISIHHLLADNNELERSVSGTRFGKFVAMVAGVAVIALLKVLEI